MKIAVEKWGDSCTRVEIDSDGQCPCCEYVRTQVDVKALDVVFVLAHHGEWGLRRVECLVGPPLLVLSCTMVSQNEAHAEIAAAKGTSN